MTHWHALTGQASIFYFKNFWAICCSFLKLSGAPWPFFLHWASQWTETNTFHFSALPIIFFFLNLHWFKGFPTPLPWSVQGTRTRWNHRASTALGYIWPSLVWRWIRWCVMNFFFTLLSMRSIWMIQWKPARIQGDELQKPLSRMIQLLYASALSTSWAFYWSCKGSGCCCCKGKFTSTTI